MPQTIRQDATAPHTNQQAALRFLLWASLVLMLDLGTKHWAVNTLSEHFIELAQWFSVFLVFNTGAAGGVSLGPHTWLINVVGTAITVLLVAGVVVPLARLDRRAGMAMGVVAGGAMGNLASLIGEPRGVPDFLALRVSDAFVVFNVADIGLWMGSLLLVPITLRLLQLAREERAARLPLGAVAQNPM
jgi:signal peptidase II